jgi:CheY-like chemotaxis protein
MSECPAPRPIQVLLVDDDFRTAQRLAALLREDGFDVEVARDGAAAVARLSRAPSPHVLVSELKLPFVDGVTVARFGRAQAPSLPVVFVARDPTLLARGALGTPPPEVLTKPLDYPQLLALLGAGAEPRENGPAAAAAGRAR